MAIAGKLDVRLYRGGERVEWDHQQVKTLGSHAETPSKSQLTENLEEAKGDGLASLRDRPPPRRGVNYLEHRSIGAQAV